MKNSPADCFKLLILTNMKISVLKSLNRFDIARTGRTINIKYTKTIETVFWTTDCCLACRELHESEHRLAAVASGVRDLAVLMEHGLPWASCTAISISNACFSVILCDKENCFSLFVLTVGSSASFSADLLVLCYLCYSTASTNLVFWNVSKITDNPLLLFCIIGIGIGK